MRQQRLTEITESKVTKSVLIVDDDPEIRSTLSECLEKKGFCTAIASSGREAIGKAKAQDFDVAILDLVMPEMDGMTVLTELKMLRPKMKVIMISAFSTVDNVVEAIKKGASEYITKPCSLSEVVTTVRRVLEEARFDPIAKNPAFDDILSSVANPVRRNIIHLLSRGQGMHFTEITRALGMADHTKLVFHLKDLREAGIITRNEGKIYVLTNESKKISEFLSTLNSYFTS